MATKSGAGRTGKALLLALVGCSLLLAGLGGAVFGVFGSRPSKDVCEARVDRLSRRVNAFVAAPSRPMELHGVVLPKLQGRARATAPYRVLEIAPTGNWMVVRLADDVPRVAAQLGNWANRESTGRTAPADGVPFYLGADARARVSDIATLFTQLGDARVQVLLLGTLDVGPLGPPPPSAKALADAFDGAASDAERGLLLAREMTARARPCKPLAKQLVLLNDMPAEARSASVTKAVDEGLRACQCGPVDIDALEYLVMRGLGAPSKDYGFIRLPNDERGHPIVPADPDLTVEQWAQRL